jgi:dynactin complex subunit
VKVVRVGVHKLKKVRKTISLATKMEKIRKTEGGQHSTDGCMAMNLSASTVLSIFIQKETKKWQNICFLAMKTYD